MTWSTLKDFVPLNTTGHQYLGIAMAAAILNDNSTTVATGASPVLGYGVLSSIPAGIGIY